MTSVASENRRRYPRISTACHVAYCLDGDIVPTTTENISRGGMRIVTARYLSAEMVFDFIITFKGDPIQTRGHIVYTSPDRRHVGVVFDRPLSLD